jgi:IS30 family transposase
VVYSLSRLLYKNLKERVKMGNQLSVSVSGTLAVELRRIANNLNVEPGVIARELIREGLANKYGITTK